MSKATQPAIPQAEDVRRQEQSRSLAEWVALGIAALILLAIVGLVVYDWLVTPQESPVLSIMQGDIRAAQGQFYVPFTVENVGANTAEAVQVLAELRIDGQVVEHGEQQIDFLSGGEAQEGAFIFSRDPRNGELTLRVASYKSPLTPSLPVP